MNNTDSNTHYDPLADDRRPFVYDLWKEHHFSVDMICNEANVPMHTVLSLFRGHAVPRGEAENVLLAISRITGKDYTTKTVRVNLLLERNQEGHPCP